MYLYFICVICSKPVYCNFTPKLRNKRFTKLKSQLSGIGVCPYDPFDNTTAVFVGKKIVIFGNENKSKCKKQ